MRSYRKFFTSQHDKSDCGPACLSTIIKFYGGYETISRIRLESGTTRTGTNLLGLYKASKKFGLDGKAFECDLENLKGLNIPVIAHVIKENIEHFIVIFKYLKKSDKFHISDPASNITYISCSELAKILKTRRILIVQPDDSFKYKNVKKEKLAYLLSIIKEDRSLIIVNLIIGIIVSVLGLSLSIILQKIIDIYLPSKDITKFLQVFSLLVLFLFFRIFFGSYRTYLSIRQTRDFNNRLINSFFSKLLKLTLSFFENKNVGDLTARLEDTQRINRLIIFILEKFILNILIILIALSIILFYSKALFLISFLTIPLFISVFALFNKKMSNRTNNVMIGHSKINSNYVDTITSIELIKSEGIEGYYTELNQVLYSKYQNSIFNLGKLKIGFNVFVEILNSTFILLIIWYGVVLVFREDLYIGEFFAIFSIANLLMPVIIESLSIIAPFNEAKVAFDRMFEYSFSEKEKLVEGITSIDDIKSINITNLDFSYPNQLKFLDNIDISINKGEIVVIIGKSGSGKTTIRKILERFYIINSGKVLVNNEINIYDISIDVWRKNVGVVHQDANIFSETILFNISLGKYSESEVVEFCNDYGFSEYFNKFPNGLYTPIGENGITLSGGQKQLIAIARVLISDYKFVILDEATSAIDRKIENFIIELLNIIKKERLVLFITHKYNILPRIADNIFLIEDGKIIERGSHLELINRSSFYGDYFNTI